MAGQFPADDWLRLVGAVPATLRASGPAGLRASDVSARAGVPPETFYEYFRDEPDCFLVAYRYHADRILAVVGNAAAAGTDWPERARFALSALLRFLAERPDVAYMATVGVLAGGPRALAERDRVLSALGELVGDRALATAPDPPPRLLLRTAAGSIAQLIQAWVRAGRTEQLEQLLPTCVYLALVAPLGPVAAAAESGLLEATLVPG
jgi:AcrR family transcriptional regulator